MLDIALWIAVSAYLLASLFPAAQLALVGATGGNQFLLGAALLPLAMLLDAVCLAAFGQTIGRALAGIKVERLTGDRLTFGDALNRNLQVYAKGLALGIPLISLFTLLHAHGKVAKGQETSWDEDLGTRVTADNASLARTIITAVVYIGSLTALSAWDRETTATFDREMPRADPSAVPDPIEAQLRTEALEMKRSLPNRLDDVTNLVDVQVSGRMITYVHELTRRDVTDDGLLTFLQTNVVQKGCSDAQMRKAATEYGVTYRYSYRMPYSANDIHVDVDREACLKL